MRVPELSLVLCAGLLCGAWWAIVPDDAAPRTDVPLAVGPARMSLPARPIRVGLTSQPARSLSIEIPQAYQVRSVDSVRVLGSGSKLARETVAATGSGIRIGKQVFPAARIEIAPARSPGVWIDGHQYRGMVRLVRRPGGLLEAVNVLPLEEYIASVVDSEMPAAFPDEARKAQAIVSRTYAVYQMQQAPAEATVDLYASTRSQKYLGFQYREGERLLAGESEAGRRVTDATRGRVCTHRGQVFCTYYCAACGGGTVRGTEVFADAGPLLQPVACDWCREARNYRWTADISKRDAGQDLRPLLARQGDSSGNVRTVSLANWPKGGYPQFDVRTDRQTARLSGAELREALSARGILSPRFSIEDRGQTLAISGQGHGHGVGFCQWGARGLALAGKTCDEIVQYYYPGAQIVRAE